MGSRLFHRKAGVVHVVDEKIEVHLLFSMLPGPRRRSEASHSMEREAADRLPAQSQPVRISLRLGQVEDLLPEPGQSLGVVALQDELGQLAYGHLSNVRASRHPQALIDQQADPVRLTAASSPLTAPGRPPYRPTPLLHTRDHVRRGLPGSLLLSPTTRSALRRLTLRRYPCSEPT